MEVQVAITMKESLGQNHARNRLSAKSYRCSILEVGEPGDFTRNGITTREILEVEPTLRAWLSYMRCRMANTRLPLVNAGMQVTKKKIRNFNFNHDTIDVPAGVSATAEELTVAGGHLTWTDSGGDHTIVFEEIGTGGAGAVATATQLIADII